MDRFFPNRIYPRVCLRRRASEALLKDLALLKSLLAYGFDSDSIHLIGRSLRTGLSFRRTLDTTLYLRSHNVWNKSALLVHVSILIFSYIYKSLVLKIKVADRIVTVWCYKP